jgi:hypothetical protein
MSSQNRENFEHRVVAALTADDVTGDGLAALLTEMAAAIAAADAAAKTEHEKALDPVVSPDPVKAHQAMEAAAFTAARLRALQPRLERRHQEASAQERLKAWQADCDLLEAERDKLADELRALYPQMVVQIADLFGRMAANDEQLSALHQRRPVGVLRHLLSAELKARGLNRFSAAMPSLAKQLKLPCWDSAELAWPPPQPSFAATYAAAMKPSFDPRFSADWWKVMEQDNAERAKITRRRQEEEEQRQVASREAYEAALRRNVR